MRVVFDTNVVVSAFLSPAGPPARLLAAWEQGILQLVVSAPLLAEYQRALLYPHVAARHGMTEVEVGEVIGAMRQFALVVEPSQTLTVIEQDPADNRVLECALAGEAEYIVSGDTRHLLPLQEYEGVHILSPVAFLAIIGKPEEQ